MLNRVWNYSKQAGSPLLVLIALADEADDEGFCYPGVPRIARKTRLSDRQVRRILNGLTKSTPELEETGALLQRRHGFRVLTSRETSGCVTRQDVRLQGGHNDDQLQTGHDDVRLQQNVTGHPGSGKPDKSETPPTPPYKADPNTDPSVTTVTGAPAPSANKLSELAEKAKAKSPDDFAIWTVGVRMMTKSVSEKEARSILGKAIKDHSKQRVVRAVIDMIANEPLNPNEYFQKTLSNIVAREQPRFDPGRNKTPPPEKLTGPVSIVKLAFDAVVLAMTTEQLSFTDAIERLSDPLQRGAPLDDLTQEELEDVVAELIAKGFGPKEPKQGVA
jgi:hypothetical protein